MSELAIWIAVGAGGAAGAVLRGLVFRGFERWSPTEAGGRLAEFGSARSTLVVNMLGSFLLGSVIGPLHGPGAATTSDATLAFWITGVCGAVTTFSTLCADAFGLARRGQRKHVAIVLLANTLLGIAALMLGIMLTG